VTSGGIHDIAHGFERAAGRYDSGRPSYPAEAVDLLCDGLGLTGEAAVADVGAGTGKLTRLLAARGLRVTAVEPVAGMRAALAAGDLPNVEVIDGTAEATGLPDRSVTAVVAAQAWHWFDADATLAEAARIATGGLGTIRNDADYSDAFTEAIWALRDEHMPPGYPDYRPEDFEAAVARAAKTAGWGTPVRHEVRHSQRLSLGGLVDRLLSTSFLAALPEDRQREIAREIRALASGDEVDVRYTTEVYAVRRT
jgi:SAM-dependent methyltransferase